MMTANNAVNRVSDNAVKLYDKVQQQTPLLLSIHTNTVVVVVVVVVVVESTKPTHKKNKIQ